MPLESLFEVPDVIAFADLVAHPEAVAAFVRAAIEGEAPPEAALIFKYPNGRKFRELVIANPIDLLRLRIALVEHVELLDRALDSGVFASRLDEGGVVWRLRDKRSAWRDAQRRALGELQNSAALMHAFDVKDYYGSIERPRLFDALEGYGVDPNDCVDLARVLNGWAERDGVRGIPIGPSASAILGTAYLRPVDEVLAERGLPFTRFTDDIRVFTTPGDDHSDLRESVDATVRSLGLFLNEAKTRVLDALAARHEISNPTLASLGEALKERGCTNVALRRTFDRLVADGEQHASPSEFRWLLRTLQHRNDDHAVDALLSSDEFLRVDPRVAGDYLAHFRAEHIRRQACRSVARLRRSERRGRTPPVARPQRRNACRSTIDGACSQHRWTSRDSCTGPVQHAAQRQERALRRNGRRGRS